MYCFNAGGRSVDPEYRHQGRAGEIVFQTLRLAGAPNIDYFLAMMNLISGNGHPYARRTLCCPKSLTIMAEYMRLSVLCAIACISDTFCYDSPIRREDKSSNDINVRIT